MSDERLRELERRWAATGVVEDEAAYLREAIRAGRVAREQVELAAYARHRGAWLALDRPDDPDPRDLARWVRGLERWGRVWCVRAAHCAMAKSLELVEPRAQDHEAVLERLALIGEWCRRTGSATEELRRLAEDRGVWFRGDHQAVSLLARATFADDFALSAANAVNRACEIAMVEDLHPAVTELVRSEALGR